MKKKIISVFLCVLTALLTFSACSSTADVALTVGGTEISQGVYSYFIDNAAGKLGKTAFSNEDEYTEKIKNTAIEEIKKFIAVNTLMRELELSLSYASKADVAASTDNRWDLFGNHYSRVGVTKQDIGKIITNEAEKSTLLNYYYGVENGVEPTKESELKAAFVKKYIGVNIIAASLTTTDNLGNTVKLNSQELSSLRNTFSDMSKKANAGNSIDEIYESYNAKADIIGTQSLETYVFTSSVTEYGEDFFKLISNLSYNKSAVMEYGDTIYLIYRVDITSDELGYYLNSKSEILESLKMKKLDEIIKAEAKNLEVTKEHSHVMKKVMKLVLSEHPFIEKETTKKAEESSKATTQKAQSNSTTAASDKKTEAKK